MLYYIHNPEYFKEPPENSTIRRLINAGVDCIQLRWKDVSYAEFLEYARILKEQIQGRIPLLINDHIDIAIACDADGVHIGQGDMSPHDARMALGDSKIIGLTAYTKQQLQAIDSQIIDYIGTGPVYETTTKKGKPVLSPNGIKALMPFAPVPVVGIGGITPANTGDVIKAGVNGVVVMSGIGQADDPIKVVKEYKRAIVS